jgi:hypothetical protein
VSSYSGRSEAIAIWCGSGPMRPLPEAESVGTMNAYDASHKIARSAWAEAARGKAFSRVTVLFHDDVAFDDAVAAVEAAGGVLASPMTTGFHTLRRVEALVPGQALETLAADERVFGLFGPGRRPHALNAQAAALSNVTPLFSAPYNLDGSGVVLSLFELAAADTPRRSSGGGTRFPSPAERHPTGCMRRTWPGPSSRRGSIRRPLRALTRHEPREWLRRPRCRSSTCWSISR